jgi:hypothetical protein
VLARQTGIPEGSGTTSYTPDFDLQPATRLFWRARFVQGSGGNSPGWGADDFVDTSLYVPAIDPRLR